MDMIDIFPTKLLVDYNFKLAEELLPLCNHYTSITDTNLLNIANFPSTLRNDELDKQVKQEPVVQKAIAYIKELIKEYETHHKCLWKLTGPEIEPYVFFSSMNKYAYLRKHKHSHCNYSGIIYLETGQDVPGLAMHNPNEFEAGVVYIPAERGKVILWPCWLEHELDQKLNDEPRKVFTFNC